MVDTAGMGEAEADRGLGPGLGAAVAEGRAYRPRARLLGLHFRVGRDRGLASVADVRREDPRGEDADVHHPHVVGGARGEEAAEVRCSTRKVPLSVVTVEIDPRRGVQQVVVDLRHVETVRFDRSADGGDRRRGR